MNSNIFLNNKIKNKAKLIRSSKWGIGLGVSMILFSFIALFQPITNVINSELLFEEMLLAGGVVRLLYAFKSDRFKFFILKLIASLIYILVGLIIVLSENLQMIISIIFLSTALLISGTIEIILASEIKKMTVQWSWLLLSGIVAILLGVLIGIGNHTLDIISFFVGINLLANGLWIFLMSRDRILQLIKMSE